MALFAAIFMLPVIGWDSAAQTCRFLIAPAPALFSIGFVLQNPRKYLEWLALIYAFFVIPTISVCLAPLASVALVLSPKIALGHLALFVVSIASLSLWFIAMRLVREKRLGISRADRYIFYEDGAAYLKLSDLQGPHTSKGDMKFRSLAPPFAGLALVGYPLQKFLTMKFGGVSVTFLLAILMTPVGCWLVAWMVCKFTSWALPIWKSERLHGEKVYIKRSD